MVRALVVGHVAFDTIVTPSFKAVRVLGGSPTYAGISMSLLGVDVKVASKVGPDFEDPYVLRLARCVDVSMLRRCSRPTTHFELTYLDGGRRLRLLSLCDRMELHDVDIDGSLDCLLLGPIANELSDDLLRGAVKAPCFKALSLQGLLRRFKPDGEVYLGPNPLIAELLRHVDLVCASLEEVEALLGGGEVLRLLRRLVSMGPRFAAITMGVDGSLVARGDGAVYRVPAYRTRAVDPTGAGDVYAGVLAATLCAGEDVEWAGCMASAAASFIVEGVGPSCFGFRGEVEERALQLASSSTRLHL